jgi:hypothetical protein
MRTVRSLALLAAMATASSAMAQEAPPSPVPAEATPSAGAAPVTGVEQTAAAPQQPPSLPVFGIMADAGIPDGAQGSLVLRPWKALRASVGGGYNMISKGVRVGVSLLPFGRGPSGTIEAGHYFEGNASAAAAKFLGPGIEASAISGPLQRVGYDFVNAHLGLDFGYKRATFYLHGGMSYVRSQVHDLDALVQSNPSINGQDMNGLQVSIPGATIKYIGPSFKVGLIVYIM